MQHSRCEYIKKGSFLNTKSDFLNEIVVDRCPHRQAFVLDHGIIGNTPTGDLVSDFRRRLRLTWINNNPHPFIVCFVSLTQTQLLSHRRKMFERSGLPNNCF